MSLRNSCLRILPVAVIGSESTATTRSGVFWIGMPSASRNSRRSFDRRGFVSRLADQVAAHLLTELLVGHAHHRVRLQRGMVGQMLLDLADADVHPAANDDVFRPARYSHVSVVGHLPEISRLGEAVLGEKGRSFPGIREVFNHVGGAAVSDVALGTSRHFVPIVVNDFDFGAGYRPAVRRQGA